MNSSSALVVGACVLVACIVFAVGRSDAEPISRAMISAVGCMACAALVYSVQCSRQSKHAIASMQNQYTAQLAAQIDDVRSDFAARVNAIHRTNAHQRKLLQKQLRRAHASYDSAIKQRNRCESARKAAVDEASSDVCILYKSDAADDSTNV